MKSTTPLSARWTCPTNKPDLSGAVRKRRTGTAKFFTLLLLPYLTTAKQRGALLAKGWLLGVQFDALFTDGLYQKLGKNAIETAERLREGFQEKGFSFYLDTPTNQIFLVVDRAQREDLARKAAFSFWEQLDEERTVIRFVTSWATRMEDVEELIRRL